EAVPALIDLLAELPADQGGPVEDLLQRLAGDQSPEAPRGGDAEALQAYRERWAGWWRQNGANADLSRLAPAKPRGPLLVLNAGAKGPTRVMELDKSGKELWAFDGPEYIGDGEVVGPDRVLLAETGPGRVTERTFKGEVVWKVEAKGACACQRLPN